MLGKCCDDAISLESLENNPVGCQSPGDTPPLGTELQHCCLPAPHTGALFSCRYLGTGSSSETHPASQLLGGQIHIPSSSPPCKAQALFSILSNMQAWPNHPGDTMEGGSKHSCTAPSFQTAFSTNIRLISSPSLKRTGTHATVKPSQGYLHSPSVLSLQSFIQTPGLGRTFHLLPWIAQHRPCSMGHHLL